MLGVPGWVVMVPYGYGYYTYLQYVAIVDLMKVFEEGKWWQDWLIYSFRRSMVGFTTYGLAVTLALFPVINLISMPLLAWLTATDYYDYVYMVSPWADQYLGESIEYMNTQEFRDSLRAFDDLLIGNGFNFNIYDNVLGFIESLPPPK